MEDYGQMFEKQLETWPLASENYLKLAGILTRNFLIDGTLIKVQFNPNRITSSSAVVTNNVINLRPCFLCAKNRPPEQIELDFNTQRTTSKTDVDDLFTILVNPFPVFPRHFTIAGSHKPQTISGNIGSMLQLTKKFDDCIVFYNGPKCGASAPDHMHFQAGGKGLMPLETEFCNWKESMTSILTNKEDTFIYMFRDFLRGGWLLEGTDLIKLELALLKIIQTLKNTHIQNNSEPMLNILCWFENGKWIIAVFPRKAHRPSCYFLENEDKYLISPASVEMGGLIVAARREDYDRINENVIKQIYNEVTLSDLEISKISESLIKIL